MTPREAQCEAIRSLVKTLRQCAKDYRAMGAEEERRTTLQKAWNWRREERELRQPLWPKMEEAA